MATTWRMQRWAALRVATIRVDILDELRLHQSERLLARLEAARREFVPLRTALMDAVYEQVSGCQHVERTRLLLTLKRKLYNGESIEHHVKTAPFGLLPEALHSQLRDLVEADALLLGMSDEVDAAINSEWIRANLRLADLLAEPRFLDGLLLSNRLLRDMTNSLAASLAGQKLTPRIRNRQAALARYLFRAASRTTPFGSFAAVAFVDVEAGPIRDYLNTGPRLCSTPQLDIKVFSNWLVGRSDAGTRRRLPLCHNPLRYFLGGSDGTLTFPQFEPQANGMPTNVRSIAAWASMTCTREIKLLLSTVDGSSTEDIVCRISTNEEERVVCRRLFEELTDAGILEPACWTTNTDSNSLGHLARAVGPLLCSEVERLAVQLNRFVRADPDARRAIVSDLEMQLDAAANRPPMFENVLIEGLEPEALGPLPKAFAQDVQPVLALIAASANLKHHRLVREAFLSRFGAGGRCNDVPSFLAALLEEGILVKRLRGLTDLPAWWNTDLGEVIRNSRGTRLVLDDTLFANLPEPSLPCSASIFMQVATEDSGSYRIVLNGVQSGRNKYLSRFLAHSSPDAATVTEDVRRNFAESLDPIPIEMRPSLGLNFQIHPRLTRWSLEAPGETHPIGENCLPLSDLVLEDDHRTGTLRLSSRRIQRAIEPIHLGAMRDLNLPDAMLLLRALSPRFGDDTVAERVDIYNTLDAFALANGSALPSIRPRLEVGRLILERARWAMPLEDVPVKERVEGWYSYLRRLAEWSSAQSLPSRCFARIVHSKSWRLDGANSRFYLDWMNPYCVVALHSLLSIENAAWPNHGHCWLICVELYPAPANCVLNMAGAPHASEWMVQFEFC